MPSSFLMSAVQSIIFKGVLSLWVLEVLVLLLFCSVLLGPESVLTPRDSFLSTKRLISSCWIFFRQEEQVGAVPSISLLVWWLNHLFRSMLEGRPASLQLQFPMGFIWCTSALLRLYLPPTTIRILWGSDLMSHAKSTLSRLHNSHSQYCTCSNLLTILYLQDALRLHRLFCVSSSLAHFQSLSGYKKTFGKGMRMTRGNCSLI